MDDIDLSEAVIEKAILELQEAYKGRHDEALVRHKQALYEASKDPTKKIVPTLDGLGYCIIERGGEVDQWLCSMQKEKQNE